MNPFTQDDSLSIAGEHIRWARSAGYSARQVVESLINRPTKHTADIRWPDALSAVAAWCEAMGNIRRAA